MTSKKTDAAELLDLERDMPLTDADIAALERARRLVPLTPEEYQRWASLIAEHHPREHRNNTDSDEPFEL